LKDHGYSKILRLRNNTDLDELRDKAADRTEWQCLVEKLGETTGEVDDSDESTTEAEDYYIILFTITTMISILKIFV